LCVQPSRYLSHAELTTCCLRSTRNWYHADKSLMFRGLKTFGSLRSDLNPKLVYVVDGERMERSEHYQERVRVSSTHAHQALHHMMRLV
jgi:hypothetical protein